MKLSQVNDNVPTNNAEDKLKEKTSSWAGGDDDEIKTNTQQAINQYEKVPILHN